MQERQCPSEGACAWIAYNVLCWTRQWRYVYQSVCLINLLKTVPVCWRQLYCSGTFTTHHVQRPLLRIPWQHWPPDIYLCACVIWDFNKNVSVHPHIQLESMLQTSPSLLVIVGSLCVCTHNTMLPCRLELHVSFVHVPSYMFKRWLKEGLHMLLMDTNCCKA